MQRMIYQLLLVALTAALAISKADTYTANKVHGSSWDGSGLRDHWLASQLSLTDEQDSRRALRASDTHEHAVESNSHWHRAVPADAPTHPDLGLDYLFVPLNKTCHPDCTKRGNCNAEEGRCECPFGYTGPTCEESLLPACQLGPLQEPFYGMLVPRSCECVRQAHRFFGCSPTSDTCTLLSLYFRDINCYEFVDKPATEQWSQMPTFDAPQVRFYTGPMSRKIELRAIEPLQGIVGRDMWNSKSVSLPLERCGEAKCNGRGACLVGIREGNADDAAVRQAVTDGVPRCLCYKGYTGEACERDYEESLCPNGCRNEGKCLRGFCHCKPGYWGLDCGRTKAWQLAPGATLVPNRQLLRIYVYNLPTHVAFPVSLDDNVPDINEYFYQTHRKFLELLLKDTAVCTQNPLEANLFMVPALAYSYSSNTNPPTNQITSALRYVAQNYPYFNASGGRDHFVWTTGDRGSCYLPTNLSNIIYVTLFGLHSHIVNESSTFIRPLPKLHPNYGCYHPRKDVLAAPWYDYVVGSHEAPQLYAKVQEAKGEAPQRDLLFFFAGSIRSNDVTYSGGARQALALHLQALLAKKDANYSDIMFVDGHTRDYHELYLRSKFCLAPHGAGFGVRLTLAMTHACVPVIIQDQVYQPYESDGVLPYSEFSLRLSKSDIPLIVPILRAVSPERLRYMRMAMVRYHRAFLWSPELGGRAYNYTIHALKQRLHGLWGHLWGEPHTDPDTRRHLRGLGQHRHHHRHRR